MNTVNTDHAHGVGIGNAGSHAHGMDAAGSHSHTIHNGGSHTHTVTITDPQHIHAATASNTGGGGAHNNMQPYLGVNFIIALQGLFPSRN